ncbi:MAG: UDP-N-acetylmuramoyl-L-alanyl-D-glutamate--2,6-diaminopimelate ligase [Clostridia bacterium]|nr:UDP-N-acetylmuramoyl-L-alanyl-D-glutamate--2,6-diaminopimelate ligase [Clostridia bacterium]
MKVYDLIKADEIISVNGKLDGDIGIFPTSNINNKEENALVFVLPRAMGENKEVKIDAAYAVVCENNQRVISGAPIIHVESARAAFARATSRFEKIDYGSLTIIGVTGTNGKTTTATLLYEILLAAGKPVGFIGTGKILISGTDEGGEGYSMTTPDPECLYPVLARMQSRGVKYVVMEVSSHAIALGKVSPIPFKCCIFTNLSPEHMDFHSDMESYFEVKSRLFELSEMAVINLDDPYGRRLYSSFPRERLGVGIVHEGDARASDIISIGLSGSSYIFRYGTLSFSVKLPLPGDFNIYNSALALAAALSLGIKPCIARAAICATPGIDGRMEIINGSVTAIIDYAHTPRAMENALKTVKKALKPKQRLFCVFGCGGERDREKRSAMGNIATELSDFTFITEDNSRGEPFNDILSDIEKGIDRRSSYTVIERREEAIFAAITRADVGDAVLIIGKGHERYIIDGAGRRPFDERLIIKSALAVREGESK